MVQVDKIGSRRAMLGEGPLWDPVSASLYWLDSMRGLIVRNGADGIEREWRIAGALIGSMTVRKAGGAVVALDDGFYAFDFETGDLQPIALPERGNTSVRFNDGKVDRQGRFLAGTSVRAGVQEARAKLYRLGTDLQADEVESDLHISNGPCFSPDGGRFYFGDSLRRRVWAYEYDRDSGTPHDRRLFFDAALHGALNDGATVDAEGCLWVALVTVGRVLRITPQGRIDRTLEMPVPHPTSVMFGGPGLDTLFVTSLRETPSGRLKATDPLSGSLFAVQGLGVHGIAETRFGA